MKVFIIDKASAFGDVTILGYGYNTYDEAKEECKRLSAVPANKPYKFYITQIEIKGN